MKIHHGVYNDQFLLEEQHYNKPINFTLAGTTLPNRNFNVTHSSIQFSTISHYLLEFVLEGEVCIKCGNNEYIAKEGDVFLVNKGTFHSMHFVDDSKGCKQFITFCGSLADSIISSFKLNSKIIIKKLDAKQDFAKILKILEDSEFFSYEVQDLLTVKIFEILQKLYRALSLKNSPRTEKQMAGDVITYIDSHLTEKITIEDLCDHIHLGKTQLIKIFKNAYGITPIRYANTQKIEFAKYLITKTDIPITQLHTIIGLCDSKYFYRMFKSSTGLSPTEYRRARKSITTNRDAYFFEQSLKLSNLTKHHFQRGERNIHWGILSMNLENNQ